MAAPRRIRGITLIELVVVMALIAIISGIVGPSIANRFKSLSLQTTATDVTARFRKAQAEARITQTPVVASYGDHKFRFFQGPREIGTLALPPSISAAFQNSVDTFLLLPSGQVTGPEYMQLVNEDGRKAVIEFGLVNGITLAQGAK
jgi:prepilin-type N-terminal cleavage/methylation domain-containing protein